MIDVPTIATLYALIGLFAAGFWLGLGNDLYMCPLVFLMWPVALATCVIIVVVAAPVAFGHWVGEHVKSWF